MNISAVLEKYKQRLQMDESMLSSQSDYPDRLLLKEIDELKIIIEALQFQQNVVRCGECRHFDIDKGRNLDICFHEYSWIDLDDYCSRGERREKND